MPLAHAPIQSIPLTDIGHVIWNFVFAVGLGGLIDGVCKTIFVHGTVVVVVLVVVVTLTVKLFVPELGSLTVLPTLSLAFA